jgi:hypothetical protein
MRPRPYAIPLVWATVLAAIAALHFQINRGGLRHALALGRRRDTLAVGHLPVT